MIFLCAVFVFIHVASFHGLRWIECIAKISSHHRLSHTHGHTKSPFIPQYTIRIIIYYIKRFLVSVSAILLAAFGTSLLSVRCRCVVDFACIPSVESQKTQSKLLPWKRCQLRSHRTISSFNTRFVHCEIICIVMQPFNSFRIVHFPLFSLFPHFIRILAITISTFFLLRSSSIMTHRNHQQIIYRSITSKWLSNSDAISLKITIAPDCEWISFTQRRISVSTLSRKQSTHAQ